jgi:hypothetical protein
MTKQTEERISVRVPVCMAGLKERLTAAATTIGATESAIVVAAICGLCEFIEVRQKMSMPPKAKGAKSS